MSQVKVHALYHVPFEGLGAIEPWLRTRNCQLGETRWFAGDLAPAVGDFDWLIVMGGPMGVHDETQYPWLAAEKRLIHETIQAGRCVLGICLGAQLIAHVLGAEVGVNDFKEIGWMEIETVIGAEASWVGRTMPDAFTTFHWHGDTFSLPSGAVHLAQSEGCSHQGFSYQERIIGLQFHPEMLPEGIEALRTHAKADMQPGPYVQPFDKLLGHPQLYAGNALFLSEILAGLEIRARR